MPWRQNLPFREHYLRYFFRGFIGLAVATPAIAVFQGWYLLSDFRKNHRDAPFPDMPCSGVVVVHPNPQDRAKSSSTEQSTKAATSWFSAFPLLSEQEEPNPLHLLVVGDSLAAGVGVTKSGTPVLPEAVAKTLSSALGGRAVYWTCVGEPGLSSPQIVKELLLDSDEVLGSEKQVDVMGELKSWWEERRQQHQKEKQDLNGDDRTKETAIKDAPKNIRAWWRRVRQNAENDVKDLKERLKIPAKLPEPAVVLPRRRNTVVPELVAGYDICIVITGFNDLKNLIFPLPPDPEEENEHANESKAETPEEDGISSNSWLEKDLLSIMRVLKGKMRNYGLRNQDNSNASDGNTVDPAGSTPSSKGHDSVARTLDHHPMVVFPATPLFAEKVYPLSWFAAPGVKIMEYQKKKLAEKYPAPVLFLEAPDESVISDYTNKRGPLWEASSREDVLFELTNKKRLEHLEALMKEYYDRWTVDVEEEEATFTYDAFGPDIQGPMQHLEERSPLISPDRVHPSDEGYELWGRHIANAIVKEWNRKGGDDRTRS